MSEVCTLRKALAPFPRQKPANRGWRRHRRLCLRPEGANAIRPGKALRRIHWGDDVCATRGYSRQQRENECNEVTVLGFRPRVPIVIVSQVTSIRYQCGPLVPATKGPRRPCQAVR